MENLLIIGINTRCLVNSALKLNYNTYSTSYFQTADFPTIKNSKCIVNELNNKSTGNFKEDYTPEKLIEESKEYLDIADYIVLQTGVSPADFKKKDRKKILGNKDIKCIEDKTKFYKKIKEKFLTPETFIIKDIYECIEIKKNNPNNQYIIKPALGSGGYDVNLLDNNNINQLNYNKTKWIMQEYIEGINVSSSVLSHKKDAKNLINSRLLNTRDFEDKNSFIYIGNIMPITNEIIPNAKQLNKQLKETSEELSKEFKLLGSNGVDFIVNNNEVYVIEINPRIQGTYECCEKVLNLNMLDCHIKACNGELIETPTINGYCYKKILYAEKISRYKPIKLDNIFDVPHKGSITEKGEPLLTIVDKNSELKELIENVKLTTSKIRELEESNKMHYK